jgi:hypothetical protein
MKILISFFTLLSIFLCFDTNASHVLGGEITWTSDGNGYYTFNMRLYRDCNGTTCPFGDIINTNAPIGFIPCTLISQSDISPVGYSCPTCLNPGGYRNAVEEFIYRSASVYIDPPPATGWYFTNEKCCRSNALTNILMGVSGGANGIMFIRSIMYPSPNFQTIYNSSPRFLDPPSIGICNSDTIYLNHAATLPVADSIRYDWAQPIESSYPWTPTPFDTGYSYTNPLPDQSINPQNIGATLDRINGTIKFYSVTLGNFVTTTKVSSYSCGTLISEIYREIVITLINCPIYTQPNSMLNTAPDFAQNYPNDIFNLKVGDTFIYSVNVSDFEPVFDGTAFQTQTLTLDLTSDLMGLNDTSNSIGCLNPPCATTTIPMPISGPSILSTIIEWQTNCTHLSSPTGCQSHEKNFQFTLKANDNFCPANGTTYKNVIISLSAPEIIQNGTTLTTNSSNYSLQWYFNGNPIAGATNSNYAPQQSGYYSALFTDSAGCSMISNVIPYGISGNEIVPYEPEILLSPNPVMQAGL